MSSRRLRNGVTPAHRRRLSGGRWTHRKPRADRRSAVAQCSGSCGGVAGSRMQLRPRQGS